MHTHQNRPDLWDQRSQKQVENIVILRNFGVLIFFPLGCCFSCWTSAGGCGAQKWGCNGVGDGHVPGGTTSFFPWWDHQGVYRQPLRGLVVPWLREIRLWKVNNRLGYSQSDGAVINPSFVCTRAHESHEWRLRPHTCVGMVDKVPNPAGGPQQLSKLRYSSGVRMLILELRGASRHCTLMLRQEVWHGDIELLDSRV